MKHKINSLLISDEIKRHLLGQKNSLSDKHKFYISLASFYAPAFSHLHPRQLEDLTEASYLYFRSLLLADSLFDDAAGMEDKLLLLLPIYEEAVKKLSWLFKEQHAFWPKFYNSKRKYYRSIKHEKSLTPTSSISNSTFREIAISKSAVCYSILEAMNDLGNKSIDISDLQESLENIHIAFQYLDDIDDFRIDLEKGQRTYIHSLIDNELRCQSIYPTQVDNALKHKYLFTSGLAEKMIKEASEYFVKALTIANRYGLTQLGDFLTTEIDKCHGQIYEINLLIEKTKTKFLKSDKVISEIQGLQYSIALAIRYLENSMEEDGSFKDFLTLAGHGKTWVTTYTGSQLIGIPEAAKITDQIRAMLSPLTQGSYNESIVEDADSLSFLIWFLRCSENNMGSGLVEKWLAFMDQSGGWCTYNDEQGLRSFLALDEGIYVNGWLAPTHCVSATALFVLSLFPDLSNRFNQTAGYLEREFDIHWKSYWWTSNIYATSFAIRAFCAGNYGTDVIEKGCDWLCLHQNENGSWWHLSQDRENAFYTAHAALALIHADFKKYKVNIDAAISWLNQNQTEDGSWKSDRILRIPSTDTINPDNIKKWRNSSFGVNILVDDHNRVFTTSTVLNALDTYRQRIK